MGGAAFKTWRCPLPPPPVLRWRCVGERRGTGGAGSSPHSPHSLTGFNLHLHRAPRTAPRTADGGHGGAEGGGGKGGRGETSAKKGEQGPCALASNKALPARASSRRGHAPWSRRLQSWLMVCRPTAAHHIVHFPRWLGARRGGGRPSRPNLLSANYIYMTQGGRTGHDCLVWVNIHQLGRHVYIVLSQRYKKTSQHGGGPRPLRLGKRGGLDKRAPASCSRP